MILEKQLHRFARRCWVTTRRHPLLPFLLAATLALDAVWMLRVADDGEGFDSLSACLLCLFLSQCSLLGIWLVHRYKGFPARLIAVTISLTLICNLFIHLRYLGEDRGFFFIVAIYVVLPAGINFFFKIPTIRNHREIPRFTVGSLLLLSTAIGITTGMIRNIQLPSWIAWSLILSSVPSAIIWNVSHWKNTWKRNVLLFLLWPLHLVCLIDYSGLFTTGQFYFITDATEFKRSLMFLTCMYFFVLIWSFGLQYQSRPTRRKREQAALALLEQPVRLHNQDVDQLDSSESTDSDDEATGPIDLRV